MFGFTERDVEHFGMTFGIAIFMLFMLFIVAELAWKSKAGKTGTLIMFFVLSLGMFGFVVKSVLQLLWGR